MVSPMLSLLVMICWQEHLASFTLLFLPVCILFYLLSVVKNSLAVGKPGTVSIENQLLPTGVLISE